MSLTDDTHALIRTHFRNTEMSLAIDATCGNGHDTVFLKELGFKKVLGFDVQALAIQATQERVGNTESVLLIQDSHANLAEHVANRVDCLMFNFGYLPTGDKNITTDAQSSIKALQAGLNLLSEQGLISLMCYPGHPAGYTETQAIRHWFSTLHASEWVVETHLAASPKPTAPILYLLKRNHHAQS